MSKKKERKIKKIRRFSIISQYWIDSAILSIPITIAIIIFIASLPATDYRGDNIALNVAQAKIIDCVNNNYKTEKIDVIQKEIQDIIKDESCIKSTCIVDKNLNIIAPLSVNECSQKEIKENLSNVKFGEYGIANSKTINHQSTKVSDNITFDMYTPTEKTIDIEKEFIRKTNEIEDEIEINKIEIDVEDDGIYYDEIEEVNNNTLKNYFKMLFFKDEFYNPENLRIFGNISYSTQWNLCKTTFDDVFIAVEEEHRLPFFNFFRFCICLLVFIILYSIFAIWDTIKFILYFKRRKNLHKVIYTDSITGGNNREYFIDKAHKCISKKTNAAIVQLRMEKYRNYCTAYGTKEGENLLEELNSLLSKQISKREMVAHLEKSDFVLLLKFFNENQLKMRIKSIIKELEKCRPNQRLIFSAGCYTVSSKKDDINTGISHAGLALNSGSVANDNVCWFTDTMLEQQVWERRVEDDMQKAIDNHEFVVYLQPKYSTKKEELSAAEALVRWIHPEAGFIPPNKFIPIFENNGFITKLDDYMLTEVCKLQAKWQEEGKKLIPISVNVSRAHFTHEYLAEHICAIVNEYKIPHSCIELELTESAFFDDKQTLLGTVNKLKRMDFKISMDDFGAGYSSLNSLKELPLDIIKLDAEFFRGVDDINRANLIVSDTINLAKKLGMEIVAEGIETRDQVDFLAQQDCDLIQGYYFAKPLPINEFEERAYSNK